MRYLFLKFVLILSLFSATFVPQKSHALDAKVSAVILMASYGTIGGALLGTASLAFGAEGRSVAKGASIGLYCGLIFGGYIVLSHQLRQNRLNNPEPPPPTDETYDESAEEGIFGYNPQKTIQGFHELKTTSDDLKFSFLNNKGRIQSADALSVNLINYTF